MGGGAICDFPSEYHQMPEQLAGYRSCLLRMSTADALPLSDLASVDQPFSPARKAPRRCGAVTACTYGSTDWSDQLWAFDSKTNSPFKVDAQPEQERVVVDGRTTGASVNIRGNKVSGSVGFPARGSRTGNAQ